MRVEDLRKKHKGQMAFLIGGGTSLSSIDEKQLKNYVTITVNSGILKCPNCDYFVSDDSDISNWSYYEDMWKSRCIKLLYKDRFAPICKKKKDVILYTHTWWFSPKGNKYNMEGLRLTQEEPIIGSRTSMGSAVHLAYIMGCDPIVLLGNDCKLGDDGKRYFWQYWPKEKQPHRTAKHIFNKRTQNFGFSKSDFTSYWKYFFRVNKDILGKQVEIIDCSDSTLKWFPKMKIKEVLEKYKGKKNE